MILVLDFQLVPTESELDVDLGQVQAFVVVLLPVGVDFHLLLSIVGSSGLLSMSRRTRRMRLIQCLLKNRSKI
jgi:hypothetical protein